jgi:thioredoxin-like negative regulator of GroEL
VGLILIAGTAVMIALTVFLFERLSASRDRRHADDQIARIAKKAAVSELAIEDRTTESSNPGGPDRLSDSAVFAIEELLATLISRGDLEAAETWAENTLRTNPEHVRVAVQLAEIHHQRGERKDFFDVLSQHIIARRDELGAETWGRLESMLHDFSQSASRAR